MKYLIEIIHLKCNTCRMFLHTFWVVFFTIHIHQLYCEITQFMKSGARKKVELFVNRPLALQCMTVKYQHKTQHTHNEAPRRPVEEKCHFFASTWFHKTDVLIVKINLMKCFSSYFFIKKSVGQEITFWLKVFGIEE